MPIVLMALTLQLSGCAWLDSWFAPAPELQATDLATQGMENFENGRYRGAITSFEKLKDWYPFSKFAILAELKIADAHYRLKEYEEAVVAYQEFESLHPRNEAIPYVIYQIGMCYFERIDTVDRDQKPAQKALETFTRLQNQYPTDPYTAKAKGDISACLRSLAGHDMYVGKFYFDTKHYQAALHRFQRVITKYPDVGVHREALAYLSKCREAIAKSAQSGKEG